MPRYDHLPLTRLPERLERRSPPGRGGPVREHGEHSARLKRELTAIVEAQQQARRPEYIDPALILRVQMAGDYQEEQWQKLGITVLSNDADHKLVLFASEEKLVEFRNRLEAYSLGAPEGQKGPRYASFINGIEAIGEVLPRDRIGSRLQEAGFTEVDDFVEVDTYVVDLEIWDFGTARVRNTKLEQIIGMIERLGGNILDRYTGPSITLARVRCSGELLKVLLSDKNISEVDLPVTPDTGTEEMLELTIDDLPNVEAIDEESPLIGIIDTGIVDHPLLAAVLAGSFGFPPELGTADDHGHGTRIAGIAAFGDFRSQLAAGVLQPSARICTAKIVNAAGGFDERTLVPRQIRESITRLHEELGCRIFVIALGDRKAIYDGRKVGAWAATLDELARELDIVIIVSAGNREPRTGELEDLEQAVTDYPGYLLEPDNRLCEPAGAANVITVGAISHGNGLGRAHAEDVRVRPIADTFQPSPFTRVGPGIRDTIKPDLIDMGGTLVLDPVVRALHGGERVEEAGMLSLNFQYMNRLFTSASGTSYAAPLVAYKAAQILRRFPSASANLIRALLAGAATIPAEAAQILRPLGEESVNQICGNGHVDMERAVYSDDSRVVLFCEDSLAVDHFAIYEIPIPELFQNTAGKKNIRITLSHCPPVRHTRNDYTGIDMDFRLIRGQTPAVISEHFRRRTKKEGPIPALPGVHKCSLKPGPQSRDRATLQSAAITFMNNIAEHGDMYYVVVRCKSGWANLDTHDFALVVQISHAADIQLYNQLRQRIRIAA